VRDVIILHEQKRWSALWEWKKATDPQISEGFITSISSIYRDEKVYCPAIHREEILNSTMGICDRESACKFVQHWGMFGFDSDFKAHREPKESIGDILDFAEYTKRIIEIKWLLKQYIDDSYIAKIETGEWIKKHYESFFSEAEKTLLPETIPDGHGDEDAYKFYLTLKLSSLRRDFNNKELRNVYIKLSPSGRPLIDFIGLYCFILFCLLSDENEPIMIPRECEDPKCKNLFFPTESGERQKYCPPPIGKKRSLCEQRHGQAERRRNTKKETH